MVQNYFNILDSAENLIDALIQTDNADAKLKNMYNIRNFAFGELISLGVKSKEMKDYDFNDDKFNYILITNPETNKTYKCRKNNLQNINLTLEQPINEVVKIPKQNDITLVQKQDIKPVVQKEETTVITKPISVEDIEPESYVPEKRDIEENGKMKAPFFYATEVNHGVSHVVEPATIAKTETPITPTPQNLNPAAFSLNDIIENDMREATEIKQEPIVPPVETPKIENVAATPTEPKVNNSYKKAMSGKIRTSIPTSDLTLCLKDVTLKNPVTNSIKIVNLTAIPLMVDDYIDKSPIVISAEGLTDYPIIATSSNENPTAKIASDNEVFGATGKWENGKFGLNLLELSESIIESSPDDEMLYMNKNNDIGHCVTEIPTPNNKIITIHTFPLQFSNNEKGASDAIIYIKTEDEVIVRYLNSEKPIYVYHNREFDAKIMCFWNNSLFNTTVDVTPKN